MLAKDYVQRAGQSISGASGAFSIFLPDVRGRVCKAEVTALCQGFGTIPALGHLSKQQQVLQAEDDLEEWQAAEQFLARWQAVEAELRNASTG